MFPINLYVTMVTKHGPNYVIRGEKITKAQTVIPNRTSSELRHGLQTEFTDFR